MEQIFPACCCCVSWISQGAVAGLLKLPQAWQCCVLSGEEEEVAVPEMPVPQVGQQAG